MVDQPNSLFRHFDALVGLPRCGESLEPFGLVGDDAELAVVRDQRRWGVAIYVLMSAEGTSHFERVASPAGQRPLLDAVAKANQFAPSVSIFFPTNSTGATRTFSTRHTGPDTRQATLMCGCSPEPLKSRRRWAWEWPRPPTKSVSGCARPIHGRGAEGSASCQREGLVRSAADQERVTCLHGCFLVGSDAPSRLATRIRSHAVQHVENSSYPGPDC